jgi:uncharacterized membrane protein required for colicin V production
MQSAARLTLLLCAAWAAALLYGEMGAYWASYLACSWPSSSSFSSPPVSAWLAVLGFFFGTAATLIVNPCSGSKNRHCVD